MTKLDDITAEMSQCDRQERIDLLLDFAKGLPPLPDRLAAHKDASHRVEECQSPVYLFVELDGEKVGLFADAPIEAPTVRGFVSMLSKGWRGPQSRMSCGCRTTWWSGAGWPRSWACSGCAGFRACSAGSRRT